jgi:hypothetical protein
MTYKLGIWHGRALSGLGNGMAFNVGEKIFTMEVIH